MKKIPREKLQPYIDRAIEKIRQTALQEGYDLRADEVGRIWQIAPDGTETLVVGRLDAGFPGD